MATPYLGEIRMFAGNFPPDGWAFCNGGLRAISVDDALFNLIGTTYGGDGQETFAVPDLRGRVPIHQGSGTGLATYAIGQTGGAESVTLTTQQIPVHSHQQVGAAVTGDQTSPQGALPANAVTITPYLNSAPDTSLNAGALDPVGGSQPHSNMQPYLCVSFIICLAGIFPSPN